MATARAVHDISPRAAHLRPFKLNAPRRLAREIKTGYRPEGAIDPRAFRAPLSLPRPIRPLEQRQRGHPTQTFMPLM